MHWAAGQARRGICAPRKRPMAQVIKEALERGIGLLATRYVRMRHAVLPSGGMPLEQRVTVTVCIPSKKKYHYSNLIWVSL